jgi:methanogenic corrinoid protein MtbC1
MATGTESRVPALHNGQIETGRRAGQHNANGTKRFESVRSGATLGSLISGEIIPRLLLAHRDDYDCKIDRTDAKAPDTSTIDGAEAARFAPLPLELEADELLAEVELILARGVSVETVFIELLAPSARRLGQLWDEDRCDFVDVTMGLWRLQEVMREITLRSPALFAGSGAASTALFCPIPGDQHSFGSVMLEEVFARAGWRSEVLFETKRLELLNIISDRNFDLIGLTISNDCPSGSIAELISAIRGVSRNSGTRIIIGGRAINADPDIVERVGADGTASDACSALALAQQLVAAARPSIACL